MSPIYQSMTFEKAPTWDTVPVGAIDRFHWEGPAPYRPKSFFQICFVKETGVFVRLWSNETNVRAVCIKRDDPVWEDSCLEFFFEPEPEGGYLNVEMNPRGVFLAQWGKARENRVFTKALTDVFPVVSPLPLETGWGVELFVPCALLEALTGTPFSAAAGDYRFCCYKCGDKTARPHWAAFAPMGDNPPGFHNPTHFAVLHIEENQP